jgi:outer membrane protein assembly factor BamB
MLIRLHCCLVAVAIVCFPLLAQSQEWSTYRGNPERTGNVDGKPGPAKPRVLWSHPAADRASKENYIGSPAVIGELLCLSGLGAFNTGNVTAFDLSADEGKIAWTKTPPLLKLPTVASPIASGKLVLFGDGMHQTDGATLRAVDAATGQLVWQHSVPGKLVHIEGAAVAIGDKLYLGAGHAGVICLDASKLTLLGQERTSAEIAATLESEWKKLLAEYEKEKEADPDFAISPSEEQLPKAAPRLVWQAGSNKWHVDAPLAVAQDRILTASAYLDLEKEGDRALLCLDAATGDVVWRTAMDMNPWAGATVVGDTALLGCSNIRLDPKEVRRGRGQLLALNLADGSVKWKKPVPGGIVSSVAVKNGLAIACATDGRVRAHDLSTGNVKWTYTAFSPLFAGPAIAGDRVYAGDLAGVVHAINLSDGKSIWKLDLNREGIASDGMIFGSPVVHGGRLYVGTCNLEPSAGSRQVVVCIGE